MRETPGADAGVVLPRPVDARGLRLAVIAASWHEEAMHGLLAGALQAAQDCGAGAPRVMRVPGSFEVPVAASHIAEQCDALVALGVVIRGQSAHFDYVCQGVTQGLMEVMVRTGVPIGFGVLMCETVAQAFDRAGLPATATRTASSESKGYEAAHAALAMAVALGSENQ